MNEGGRIQLDGFPKERKTRFGIGKLYALVVWKGSAEDHEALVGIYETSNIDEPGYAKF